MAGALVLLLVSGAVRVGNNGRERSVAAILWMAGTDDAALGIRARTSPLPPPLAAWYSAVGLTTGSSWIGYGSGAENGLRFLASRPADVLQRLRSSVRSRLVRWGTLAPGHHAQLAASLTAAVPWVFALAVVLTATCGTPDAVWLLLLTGSGLVGVPGWGAFVDRLAASWRLA